MDTAPIPPVGGRAGDAPTRPIGPVPATPRERPGRSGRPGRLGAGLRALEVVAGLASGGLLIVGVALLVLQFVAPELAPGTGLAAASGPGWWRVAAQLGVGVAGECAVLARRRSPSPVRWVLAGAVIVAAGAVLWFAWWA